MLMPFDLILMDVRMPGIDGLEATRRIRALSPVNAATPILAVTADVQADNAAACREAGMNDHIGKPISPQELLTKIAFWGAQAAEAEQQQLAAG
jgi:CheY-like chemotaxis protein